MGVGSTLEDSQTAHNRNKAQKAQKSRGFFGVRAGGGRFENLPLGAESFRVGAYG